MSRSQIAERLASGDNAGAVRLAAREQAAKLKQAQKTEWDLKVAAFTELVRRYPEVNTEFMAGQLRLSLAALGLKGTNIQEMEQALQHTQQILAPVAESAARRQTYEQAPAPPATTRQTPSERRAEKRNSPEDPTTIEAKKLIAEGRITRESIAAMSSLQYERAISSPVFNKALELLEPQREPSMLTLGELQQAHGHAHRLNQQQGQAVVTADIVEAVERSKREYWTSVNQDPPPMPSPADKRRSGIVNLERTMPVPKSLSARQIAAGQKQEQADHAFIDSAREKTARRRRVLGNRRGQ